MMWKFMAAKIKIKRRLKNGEKMTMMMINEKGKQKFQQNFKSKFGGKAKN